MYYTKYHKHSDLCNIKKNILQKLYKSLNLKNSSSRHDNLTAVSIGSSFEFISVTQFQLVSNNNIHINDSETSQANN